MGQVTQTLTWRTEVGDVRPWAFFRKPYHHAIMITQVKKYCMNGDRTSKIHQDGAAPGRKRPTLATGGQTFVSRRTRGPKSNTTEYNKANTQLKIMQWNAEGVIRRKPELEHILKKENIDICCIQDTHLQKDKRFRVRGYQCFRTDREDDKRKGGVLTLIRSSINAYMSNSSTHSAENQTMIIQTTNRNFTIVNYRIHQHLPTNVVLEFTKETIMRYRVKNFGEV